jgi:hypothetical protein
LEFVRSPEAFSVLGRLPPRSLKAGDESLCDFAHLTW